MIRLAKLTAERPIAKRLTLSADGRLHSVTSAAVDHGRVEVVTLPDIAVFADLLASLGTTEVLTYGTPTRDGALTTMRRWVEAGRPAHLIPRTNASFSWPDGPGVMMLDIDAPKDGSTPLTREELLDALDRAAPHLGDGDRLWWPSGSSSIHTTDGRELRGVRGQRVYVAVEAARDIPRAAAALDTLLWAAGFGHAEVSTSGSTLLRGLFDTSVYQPSRLDFAGGADCGPGLVQRRGAPVLLPGFIGGLLDTRHALPEPMPAEIAAADRAKAAAKKVVADCAAEVRREWTAARVEELRTASPDADADRLSTLVRRAVENRDLGGDWQLVVISDDGAEQTVRVGDVLDAPDTWHGRLTLDPLEPDYDGRRAVGKLFLFSARPTLYSFAHGGVAFRLSRKPARIQIVAGHGRETTDATLDVLRAAPDVFDFGDTLVSVASGRVQPLDEHGLRYAVGGMVQFFAAKRDAKGRVDEEPKDPPIDVCKQVLALGGQRSLKSLSAVITAPTLRADGSVLTVPGYDTATRLLLEVDALPVAIPERPTTADAQAALDTLWRPFSQFPFVGSLDRAALLAALLTAAVRPTLPTAPAFAFDAPSRGSGKSLLARCVAALCEGGEGQLFPFAAGRDGDDELRKKLFAVLRAGARTLVIDNIVGTFDSSALAAVLTAPMVSDRILGVSKIAQVPNKALVVLTGNNIALKGELPRRVITCRIDPATERPFARRFDVDPFAVCRDSRQEMIAAALTLIRAYLTSGLGSLGSGRLASFETWDEWVRQSVLLANRIRPGEFGDVMTIVDANMSVDIETEALGSLLAAWHGRFGDAAVSVGDVVRAAAAHSFTLDMPADSTNHLREALVEIVGTPHLSSVAVGRALSFRIDRVVGDRRLARGPDRGGRRTWRVARPRA